MNRAIPIFLLLVGVSVLIGYAMNLDDALEIFPGAGDPMIAYSAAGKATLEEIIQVLEERVGVRQGIDYTDESVCLALRIDPGKKDLVNKLSQCYYVLGDVFSTDKKSAMSAFDRGRLWGLTSLRMNPKFATTEKEHGFIVAIDQETDVAALYWTCANWGSKDEYDK